MKKRVEEFNGIIYVDGLDIYKALNDLSNDNDRLFKENQKLKSMLLQVLNIVKDFREENIYDNDFNKKKSSGDNK